MYSLLTTWEKDRKGTNAYERLAKAATKSKDRDHLYSILAGITTASVEKCLSLAIEM